jgi:hypothetical protein
MKSARFTLRKQDSIAIGSHRNLAAEAMKLLMAEDISCCGAQLDVDALMVGPDPTSDARAVSAWIKWILVQLKA